MFFYLQCLSGNIPHHFQPVFSQLFHNTEFAENSFGVGFLGAEKSQEKAEEMSEAVPVRGVPAASVGMEMGIGSSVARVTS